MFYIHCAVRWCQPCRSFSFHHAQVGWAGGTRLDMAEPKTRTNFRMEKQRHRRRPCSVSQPAPEERDSGGSMDMGTVGESMSSAR